MSSWVKTNGQFRDYRRGFERLQQLTIGQLSQPLHIHMYAARVNNVQHFRNGESVEAECVCRKSACELGHEDLRDQQLQVVTTFVKDSICSIALPSSGVRRSVWRCVVRGCVFTPQPKQ